MIRLKPQKKIQGTFYLPGDKSISHRALVFSLFSRGTSVIENLNVGQDVGTTVSFLSNEEARVLPQKSIISVQGFGLPFINKTKTFDCANSGTTLSLLLGTLRKKCLLTGDKSLRSRSFLHQISVLKECGFQFKFYEREGFLPFEIFPPSAIEKVPSFTNTVNSAQLKTTLLLTALNYGQRIQFKESILSRDHTERLLKGMGADIKKNEDDILMESCTELKPLKLFVPSDISLASFFITAVLLAEDSHVILKNISLNPNRLAFIRLLKEMKAHINIINENDALEPYGDVEIFSSSLEGGEVPSEMVGALIDEIPCLALLGLIAHRGMTVRGAGRLRNKETDRISALCYNLKMVGAHVLEFEDGLSVQSFVQNKSSFMIKSFQDHRMVMAFSLLAFLLKQDFSIDEPEWVNISYPRFFKDMFNL